MRSLCLAALVALAGPVQAAEFDFNMAHFMPAGSWQNTDQFQKWADEVAAASGGRINTTVFPAQTLGKAAQGYENAATGIADIAWTVQGYTAGRFPLSQVIELPGLFKTAAVGSCAFQKLYDSGALAAEYADTHVLYVHTHGEGLIHTKGKPVRTLADLKGLKIRRPTPTLGKLLTELGAEPIGMPAPGIYEAMQRGTIDGYMLPWEATQGFRLNEVSDTHTEFGFYSLAFVTTMNKAAYEKLPADLKSVIDAHSGMAWAVRAGRGYDAADVRARAAIAPTSTVLQIEGAERAEWEAAAQRTTKAYLAELDAAGLPGTATYAAVQGYVSACQSELGQ